MVNCPPSKFTDYLWSSIFKKCECEIVARNIIVILSRTGDVWRELSWDEYKKERLNDSNFTNLEKRFFVQVISYCVNDRTAVSMRNKNIRKYLNRG